jgi:predicted transcriptional regulator
LIEISRWSAAPQESSWELAGRISIEKGVVMTDATNTARTSGTVTRTLAVRITDDLRAQLEIVAQLTGRSVTEEIRLAVENWVERSKSDPEVLRRAEAVRAEIEREARVKSTAIDSIFGKSAGKLRSGSPASGGAAKSADA